MNDNELRLAYARELAQARRPERAACPSPETLVGLVDREGSEAERLEALDHVMSCDGCRRDFELLRATTGAGTQLMRREQRFNLRWVRGSPWRLASAAVLVLAIGGITTLAVRNNQTVSRGPAEPLLVGPTGSVASSDAMQLVWRRAANATRYQVELLSAAGDSVYTTTTQDTTLVLSSGVRLTRGSEYLWSVRAFFRDGTQAAAAPLRFRIQP